jgi:hypothetical protein
MVSHRRVHAAHDVVIARNASRPASRRSLAIDQGAIENANTQNAP